MKKSVIDITLDTFYSFAPLPNVNLAGKTIVIVGANTGLGFEAAKRLAAMGPGRFILGCRSQSKGEVAVRRIQEEVGYDKAEMWLVDLCDFGSVKRFIERVVKKLGRLDLLVLNAAVMQHPGSEHAPTKDGFEEALQVNSISQSLIVLRCIPLLLKTSTKSSVKSRVVFVGSEGHYFGNIPDAVLYSSNAFRTMGSKRLPSRFNVLFQRYLDTKLLNLFFVRALATRLSSTNVIVTCVNPGMCHSELQRSAQGIVGFVIVAYQRIFARKAEEGGEMIAWACVGAEDDEESLRGAYINLNRVDEPSDFVLGSEGKRREDKLWDDLVDLLVDVDPEVKGALSTF